MLLLLSSSSSVMTQTIYFVPIIKSVAESTFGHHARLVWVEIVFGSHDIYSYCCGQWILLVDCSTASHINLSRNPIFTAQNRLRLPENENQFSHFDHEWDWKKSPAVFFQCVVCGGCAAVVLCGGIHMSDGLVVRIVVTVTGYVWLVCTTPHLVLTRGGFVGWFDQLVSGMLGTINWFVIAVTTAQCNIAISILMLQNLSGKSASEPPVRNVD